MPKIIQIIGSALAAMAVTVTGVCAQPPQKSADTSSQFVVRMRTKLMLAGHSFRFGGPNIEWLGLTAYGPHDPIGPRYPTHLEIDDAMQTAKMMGAKVVRSQTMGDSIGCDLCIEPKLGVFNPNAFDSIDYAIKSAREHGIRLIITLAGDCATCTFSGPGQYLKWLKKTDPKVFFTNPDVIAAYEAHVAAVLNHKNGLTGVAYKDDPTILAWENCNVCSLGVTWTTTSKDMKPYLPWIDIIGGFIKSIDPKHLYLDTTGFFRVDQNALDAKTPDMVTWEYYQHWDAHFPGQKTTVQSFVEDAAAVTAHGKVYIVNEYGWDKTNWPTRGEFAALLHTLEADPNISGDNYWALQAHAANFGWQPISADTDNPKFAEHGESGQWWALFYGGRSTLVNASDDMQARAEQLRTHAFLMAGEPLPPHETPIPPVITTKGRGFIGWRGSPGAVSYSVQRRVSAAEGWRTICDKCATDSDAPWIDQAPPPILGAQYRVIAFNADGDSSQP